jgi:TolA-binding protein
VKRLVERELSPQSVEGEARALLEAMSPHAPALGMKQRVRAALLATPLGTRGARPRAALVLAFVLLASVAAAATYLVRGSAPAAVVVVAAPPHVVVAASAAPRQAERAPGPSAEGTAARAPAAEPKGAPMSGRSAAKPNDDVSEANLLFEATRALRREGNPERATQLLAEYRKKFPRGALAEEALALSIEAAVARGDARAAKLARRYLDLYPQGHFVDKARRALGTSE